MQIARLSSYDELTALAPEWAELWRRAPAATPFQSPAWLLPWWRHFGRNRLQTIAVRDGGRLIGLLPLYDVEPGKLMPVGVALSDHLDALIDGTCDGHRIIAEAMLRTCAEAKAREIELPCLSPQSSLLQAPRPAGWSDQIAQDCICPVMAMAADAIAAALPPAIHRKLRYYRRRTLGNDAAAIRIAPVEALPAVLDRLFDLHAQRWRARSLPGVLGDPAVQAFHREAAPGLAAAGLLRLYVLTVEDRTCGVLYSLRGRDCLYCYIHGFDPTRSQVGAGTLLVGQAIEDGIRDGLRRCDFLRGGETYKYRWGAKDAPLYRRRLTRV